MSITKPSEEELKLYKEQLEGAFEPVFNKKYLTGLIESICLYPIKLEIGKNSASFLIKVSLNESDWTIDNLNKHLERYVPAGHLYRIEKEKP